ncbi:MAG: DNA-binding response regulator [Oleiphilus sp.]|nr:MAG: DNA-binding response regulator [Oleiphilus sp.]
MHKLSGSQPSGLRQGTVKLKVLVVEDHPVYLDGLKHILSRMGDALTLICVETVSDAQRYLNEQGDFDLVLLDLGLPDEGGLSLLNFISQHKLFVPAVILSASDSRRDVQHALQCGASGFISKASNSEEILTAINQVLEGEICLPSFYQQEGNTQVPSETAGFPELTPRQKEVLQLVCEGLPNKKICQRLNLTEHTVKSHLKTLFATLKVHNRTECARVAQEWHLLG